MPYYAVLRGHVPGIYDDWDDAEEQIYRFSGCKFKRFNSLDEAEAYLERGGIIVKKERPARPVAAYAMHRALAQTQPHSFSSSSSLSSSPPPMPTPTPRPVSHQPITSAATRYMATVERVEYPHAGYDSERNEYHIYVHCECDQSVSPPENAVAGIYFNDSVFDQASKMRVKPVDRSRVELFGVLDALDKFEKIGLPGSPVVYIKSSYVHNVIYRWGSIWMKNNWRKATGDEVQNQDIIKPLMFKIDVHNYDKPPKIILLKNEAQPCPSLDAAVKLCKDALYV